MEGKVALELKNITKTFGNVIANKSVSLEVSHGEILSILGENGSGKSTTLSVASGIEKSIAPSSFLLSINLSASSFINFKVSTYGS